MLTDVGSGVGLQTPIYTEGLESNSRPNIVRV